MGILNQLAVTREKAGLSQKEAALKADIHWRSIQDYELGKRTPPLEVARRIADALGCTVEELWPEQQKKAS